MKTKRNLHEIPLSELKLGVTEWEHEHIEKHGRIHCDSLDCFTFYLLVKKTYEFRAMRENQPKRHVIIRYKIVNTNINADDKLTHKIYAYKKDVNIGDTIILAKDVLRHIVEYTVNEITYTADGIGLEAILIFTKIIKKK